MEVITFQTQIKPNGSKIGGRAVYYNQPVIRYDRSNKPYYMVLKKGSFDKSLASNQDIFCIYNHDENKILGKLSAGNLKIVQDADGLLFECDPPPTQLAKDLATEIEYGLVKGVSVGFLPTEKTWEKGEGAPICWVSSAELDHVSPVINPAQANTSLDLLSVQYPKNHIHQTKYLYLSLMEKM